jgi:hypothetical protein
MAFFTNGTELKSEPAVRHEILHASELSKELLKRGYRYCTPKATTWRSALLFRHADSVLCVLLRKNGVDLRYYPLYKDEISIDSNNVASFIGGELFRNHYSRSFRTHRYILSVARAFAQGTLKRNQLQGVTGTSQSTATEASSRAGAEPGSGERHFFATTQKNLKT